MFLLCAFTVKGEMKSLLAISSLESPWAINRAISSSLSLKFEIGLSAGTKTYTNS
jgi:hypothetical protein